MSSCVGLWRWRPSRPSTTGRRGHHTVYSRADSTYTCTATIAFCDGSCFCPSDERSTTFRLAVATSAGPRTVWVYAPDAPSKWPPCARSCQQREHIKSASPVETNKCNSHCLISRDLCTPSLDTSYNNKFFPNVAESICSNVSYCLIRQTVKS